jgi:hypothetical protein
MVQNNALEEFPLGKKENYLINIFDFCTNHKFQVDDRIDIQDEVVVHEIS